MKTNNININDTTNTNTFKNNQLFCGYASVFNVLDNHNDIILPNAICNIDSIKNIPILWQHDVKKPVGKVVDAYIDDIGLFIYADINQELIYGKIVNDIICYFFTTIFPYSWCCNNSNYIKV